MRRFWWAIALSGVLSACSGDDGPPLDELSLRDALGASPDAVSLLSDVQLRALAERFEAARHAQYGAEELAVAKTPEAEIRLVDDARKRRGDDVLVAGVEVASAIEPRPNDVSESNEPLPPIDGLTDAERRALDGRAGEILLDLLQTSGATRIERIVQWPIGAVAIGDTVYVNGVWLVIMASLPSGDAGVRPTLQPAALHGNPYNTYSSLAACTTDVGMRCDACLSTGGCDDKATLSDFGDGRTECEWLAADRNRIARLCAAALMSLSTVARCVRDRSGCSIADTTNSTTGIASSAAFLAQTRCVEALNVCLSGGSSSSVVFVDAGTDAPPPATSPPPENKGCQNPFAACASSWKACDNACKSGSCNGGKGSSCNSGSSCSSCSSCSSNQDNGCSCNKSSPSGSSSSSGSSNNCKGCETASSAMEPYVPSIALVAPLVYLVIRSRRRA